MGYKADSTATPAAIPANIFLKTELRLMAAVAGSEADASCMVGSLFLVAGRLSNSRRAYRARTKIIERQKRKKER